MAQVDDRKGSIYSQKQSIRDELSAPQYLESAGDVLIKNLAKKQTNTSTTLQEQLEIVQNFEKGFELNPEVEKGIASLKEFRSRIQINEEADDVPIQMLGEFQNVDELMKITGLSRHELELSLSEKPNSVKSQLYKFAISSKRQKLKPGLESQLPDHPINKLKEIEEECFGHLKREKNEREDVESQPGVEKKPKKRKHGKRKRRKKGNGEGVSEKQSECVQMQRVPVKQQENNVEEGKFLRPSLWDIKDMNRWSQSKMYSCAPRTYYTIKDGKIVKLDKDPT